MKIKLSKSQWRMIGQKTGWMKKAEGNIDQKVVSKLHPFLRQFVTQAYESDAESESYSYELVMSVPKAKLNEFLKSSGQVANSERDVKQVLINVFDLNKEENFSNGPGAEFQKGSLSVQDDDYIDAWYISKYIFSGLDV